jgi:alpha-D-ribose 1-methylphosphonate 5-triphosphate synthase subunit PhnG
VKLTSVAVFAAGYVIGSKAGHERYAQIIDAMAKASQRLEEFSSRRPLGHQDQSATRTDSDSRLQETPI